MFRIYKRGNSKYYHCDVRGTNPEGEEIRIRQSTKKATRAEANRYAVELEEKMLRRAGADSETSDAVLACLEEAARLHGRQQLTLERARELLARMLEASSGEALKFYTVHEWFTEWLADRRAVIKASTADQYESHVRNLLSWLGADADKRLETLTRKRLTAFRDALQEGFRADKSGKPLKPLPRKGRTVDFTIGTISAGLRVAVEDGILLANPAQGVEPLGAGDSEEREPFTPEEVETLFSAATSPEWEAFMGLGFYVGMRLMDAATLRWHSVDLPTKTIRFVPRKTSRMGRELEVPIHPRLADILEALPSSDDPDAFVLPSLATMPRQGRTGLSAGFIAIMEGAGVGRMAAKEGKGGSRQFYRRGFHSYRHSFASTLAAKGVAPEIRMKLLGHSSMHIHQKYTHTELDQLATELEKLS